MRMNFLHKLKEFCHQPASVSLVLKGNSFLALHQERGKASVLLFWEIPPWQEAARAAPCGGAGRGRLLSHSAPASNCPAHHSCHTLPAVAEFLWPKLLEELGLTSLHHSCAGGWTRGSICCLLPLPRPYLWLMCHRWHGGRMEAGGWAWESSGLQPSLWMYSVVRNKPLPSLLSQLGQALWSTFIIFTVNKVGSTPK